MGMGISENKLLDGPSMTNEREKEEKAALHGLLDQIQVQVRHQKLGLVRKWSYFYFFGRRYACQLNQMSKNEQGQPIINRLTRYSSKLPKIAGRC